MARRAIQPKPVRTYPYQSDTECEEAEETGGRHLLEAKVWPPTRSRAGEAISFVSGRCARCNCHLLVYADNDVEQSGIEVKVIGRDLIKK